MHLLTNAWLTTEDSERSRPVWFSPSNDDCCETSHGDSPEAQPPSLFLNQTDTNDSGVTFHILL